MTANTMSRLVRRAFPGRNPLATFGDRIEGAVLALGVVVALLAVPVAGAVGSEIYATHESRVETEQKRRTQVSAVLVEDAPSMDGAASSEALVETTDAVATWRTPDGLVRKGVVRAPYGAGAGTTLRIWVDLSGEPAEPPMTNQGAAFNAIFSALLLWGLIAGTMALVFGLVRFACMRVRLRWWQLEWELTAPDWTGR
ncbi:Rv1733c family protein [Lentzea sp. NPDC054927]